MTAKVKCLSDAEGFKKGSSYPVLTFGETVCMVENEDGKVVGLALTKINDDSLWELSFDDAKAGDSKPKPADAAAKEATP